MSDIFNNNTLTFFVHQYLSFFCLGFHPSSSSKESTSSTLSTGTSTQNPGRNDSVHPSVTGEIHTGVSKSPLF